ncbi:triose-phosphate isomerase [Streptomyces sp. Da 82-17]|uniref:triose-phosphate isomerase n=1 Tax=Streptomyces sp. Da 82-17 TaxID=3377116 RepID=UPI0038D4AC04
MGEADAWTGEVSVPQAADAGAELVEIGHSERRTPSPRTTPARPSRSLPPCGTASESCPAIHARTAKVFRRHRGGAGWPQSAAGGLEGARSLCNPHPDPDRGQRGPGPGPRQPGPRRETLLAGRLRSRRFACGPTPPRSGRACRVLSCASGGVLRP